MRGIFDEVSNDLESLSLNFRINDLDDSLEIERANGWERITQVYRDITTLKLKELGYGTRDKYATSTAWEAITMYAHKNRYNPITGYFDNIIKTYRPGPADENGIPQPYKIKELSTYFDNPDGWFGRWSEPHRQESGCVHSRSVPWAEFRHEGRRSRRWLCAGCSDGGYEPALHR